MIGLCLSQIQYGLVYSAVRKKLVPGPWKIMGLMINAENDWRDGRPQVAMQR